MRRFLWVIAQLAQFKSFFIDAAQPEPHFENYSLIFANFPKRVDNEDITLLNATQIWL